MTNPYSNAYTLYTYKSHTEKRGSQIFGACMGHSTTRDPFRLVHVHSTAQGVDDIIDPLILHTPLHHFQA